MERWDRPALSQVREGTESHAERPRQHDGGPGSKTVVLPSRALQMYCTATITLLFWESLLSSENEMDTAVGLNDIAHLSDPQGEGSIFEWLLHLSRAEGTEIPTFASRAAVREICCELGEFLVGSVDLIFVTLEDLDSFGLRAGYFGLGQRVVVNGRTRNRKSHQTSLQLEGFLLPECFTKR